jgi:hypothetical protein
MKGNSIDISVSRLLRREFGGATQFAKCLIEPLEPHQRQAEGVVNASILRSRNDRAAKNALAVGFPLKRRVQISRPIAAGVYWVA